MAQEYGSRSLITPDAEFCMSEDERIKHSLADPTTKSALTTRQMTPIIKARIQYALADLTHGLAPKAIQWLEELAKTSPKAAFQCYLELLEFTQPKQKSVEVTQNINDNRPARAMSLQELEASLAERVVSEQ